MKIINVEKWILFHALLMSITGIYCCWSHSTDFLLPISMLSFAYLIYLNHKEFSNFTPYGGYANWITLCRYLILIALIANGERMAKEAYFAIGALLIAMDGLDGWAARYFQQTSTWGALFDKEVDSFFVFCFALLAYIYTEMPIWVLGLGLLHYCYELVLALLGWQYIQTPANPIGKYAAVVFFIGLLGPFILPFAFAIFGLSIAGLLVVASFGISFGLKVREAYLSPKS